MYHWYLIGILLSFLLEGRTEEHAFDKFPDYGGTGYLSDLHTEWGMSHNGREMRKHRCVKIPSNLTLCNGIGYNEMSIPNLVGHDSVNEAVEQSGPWNPLLNIACHPDTQLFLCSLYAPVCLDIPIYPCRSLCEGVKQGCEQRMNKYDYPWPEILRCDQFPLETESNLCIKQVNFDTAQNSCIPCKQPETYESLMDNYCWADFDFCGYIYDKGVKFENDIRETMPYNACGHGNILRVVRGKVKKSIADGDNKQLMLQVRKTKDIYKSQNISEAELKRFSALLIGGNSCECGSLEETQSKKLIMGRKDGSGFVVTYISTFRRKGPYKKEYKKAKKSFSQDHDCTAKIKDITGSKIGNGSSGSSSHGSRGKKGGKGRGKGDKNKKKKDKKDKKKRRKNKKKKGRKDRNKSAKKDPNSA